MKQRKIIVLKFGSSVLRATANLSDVVDEIYRHTRLGKQVLAVVSAFEGHTDRLLAEAHAAFGLSAPEATASYVATGELQSAAMLTGSLLQAGVAARFVDPRETHLRVKGELLNAQIHSVDTEQLTVWFGQFSVLVLPGFFGVDEDGRVALLGRGGSDYTALFLARHLGAECRLVKDVAGIYDCDPAIAGNHAHRHRNIGWDAAISVAGKLVQSKAILFARDERLPFAVGALSASEETLVGSHPATLAVPQAVAPPPLRVALLGLGTVGKGVYARLAAQPHRFQIARVLVRDPDKHRDTVPQHLLTSCPSDAIGCRADLIIDCLSGISLSADLLRRALETGHLVISANKAAVARHWAEIARFSRTDRPRLRFSAAVGGALPVLETLALYAPRVQSVRGIINGTCNYILDAMRHGATFESALTTAQAAGFAEADPAADISGADAMDKLRLMAIVGFNTVLSEGSTMVRGIDSEIQCNRTYLVATLARNGNAFEARVAPQELLPADFLAGARREENRIEIELTDGTILRLAGRGAGRCPTTTSVVGDALQLWREHCGHSMRRGSNPAFSNSKQPSATLRAEEIFPLQ